MKWNTFLYIASNLLLVQLMSLELESINLLIHLLCILAIFSVGLAHGAIDNILYKVPKGWDTIWFIVKYVAVILIFGCCWWLIPNLAFVAFLLVSAYHFGQSQFVEYAKDKEHPILYLCWGGLILSSMLWFNQTELLVLDNPQVQELWLAQYLVFHSGKLLYLFGIGLGLFFSYFVLKTRLTTQVIFKELYVLGLIILSFKILSAFVAFSLFFVWIHSLQVIQQEYTYCKKEKNIQNITSFLKLFLPLTLLSFLGISFFLAPIIYFEQYQFIPYLMLILLSCVTIPHAFVMQRFYQWTQL